MKLTPPIRTWLLIASLLVCYRGLCFADAIGNLSANLESGQDTIVWNLYNKVVGFINNTDTSLVTYQYDAAGNRVAKHYSKIGSLPKVRHDEYYIRDAGGNILATYKGSGTSRNPGFYHDFALASHDIYGSSRLGQKQYYGQEIGMTVDGTVIPTGVYDTVRLFARVPWYSLECQDVITIDSTNPYGNSDKLWRYAKHGTGQNEYEVPDHLGNVLATLSDKRKGSEFTPVSGWLTTGVDALIDAWAPIVPSAHDHYPFGQYIPGRYTVDTATHCFTTTYSGMGNVLVYRGYDLAFTSFGGAFVGIVGATSGIGGGLTGYHIYSTGAGMGGEIDLAVSSYCDNVQTAVNSMINLHDITVTDVSTGSAIGPTLSMASGIPTVITVNITSTPHSGNIHLKIECTNPGGGDVELVSIRAQQDTVVPRNIVSTVCNNDGYRYGYNGQMKENEVAGVGNHYSALYWEYDPRIGRRWNKDDWNGNPSISTYSTFSGNPISRNDPLGNIDDWVEKKDGNIVWDKDATSQATTKPGEKYLGKAVVDFKGSRDEKLGEGENLFGKGAKLADVTVYGPKGENDIQYYKGLSMTSDFKTFGAIDDGDYTVSYRNPGKSGALKSNWAINNTGPVNTLDGVNPSPIHPYSATQKDGVYIHTSNRNGWAGKTYYKDGPLKGKLKGGVTTGCLIITPTQYDIKGNVKSIGWNEFNQQLNGVKQFHLQVNGRSK
ncbi:hypothetical protein GCM10023093_07930 [Nemorincola caseinilytica]|uniref:RHS repeat-associated core domain-containing protein n=1 Tax=Nemorincola caseinilytica TaxID=2054315 RepID=A0ABP8N9A4_9BACT